MNYLDCYIRVSTKEQAEDGNSLNNQIRIGKSVAKKLKLKFRLRNEGARSSTIHYREVFEELKDEIKQGNVTHVWCLDRSRMFRDMIDSMMFRKEYLEACKSCNGRDHNVASVDAAIQTKEPLSYKQVV